MCMDCLHHLKIDLAVAKSKLTEALAFVSDPLKTNLLTNDMTHVL